MKKINVAVLGLGRNGEGHLRTIRSSPLVDRIYGYEPNAERAAKRGTELGIATFSELGMITDNPEIDLVYISSPNDFHCELAIAALNAGKAVLCEKPMGVNLAETKMMLETAERNNAFLQIGFELHYSKLYMKVKDWIAQGLIGRPLISHCVYHCSEFHDKGSWRSLSPTSLLSEKMCHYLELPLWWFGQAVTDVYSMHAPNVIDYYNHPDNHQVSYRFANGAISQMNFTVGFANTGSGDPLIDTFEVQAEDGHALRFLITGTKGAIETDVFRRRIRRWSYSDSPERHVSTLTETINFPKEEGSRWYHNSHDQDLRVIELVASGTKPENPPHLSAEAMKLCYAAEISERENRMVKFSEFTF
ncbi:MAG: Gfo/Idh/MocA family oxidoreductase [Victivallales bacterium]|jgi:predicted dehydrogenase